MPKYYFAVLLVLSASGLVGLLLLAAMVKKILTFADIKFEK